MTAPRQMSLRYAGTCRSCGAPLPAGILATYEPDTRTVRCLACSASAQGGTDPGYVSAPEPAPIDYGHAGASARREHERRVAKDEQRLRDTWGPFGGFAVAVSSERRSTNVWARGAGGEAILGARLDRLRPDGIVTLHDRRMPGSRGNIDHMAVTASGVLVIDAKRYKGRPQRLVQGGLIRPRTERLLVGRRDVTSLLAGVHKQVETVRRYLDDVPVRGALCFVEADWPLLPTEFQIEGLVVTWPRRLASDLKASNYGEIDVEAVARVLATRFKPA